MALARASVSVIAGSEAHCNMCHSATREDIRRWGEAMQAVEAECFAHRGASAEERIECLKDVPNDPDSTFSPARLGLYSAAVTHKALRGLFEPGYVPQEDIESEWEEESQDERYLNFKNQAAMPMRGRPLTESEFSMVKRWVLSGMQGLDEAMDEVEADENAS